MKQSDLMDRMNQNEDQGLAEKEDNGDGGDEGSVEGVPGGPPYRKILDMQLETQTNLVASAISDDGRWLAVSDLYETKLFFMRDVVSLLLSCLSASG